MISSVIRGNLGICYYILEHIADIWGSVLSCWDLLCHIGDIWGSAGPALSDASYGGIFGENGPIMRDMSLI